MVDHALSKTDSCTKALPKIVRVEEDKEIRNDLIGKASELS